MTLFIILALALLGAALLLVLPALLRRMPDEDGADHNRALLQALPTQRRELDRDLQHRLLTRQGWQQARQALESRAAVELESAPQPGPAAPAPAGPARKTALLVGLAMPALALLLYLGLGNPAAVLLDQDLPGSHAQAGPDVEAMVQKLARRLQQQPEDADGWEMLARSWTVLGRHPEAVAAWRRVMALKPDNADVLVEFADELATANGGNLQDEPRRLVQRALELDPRHVKGLALAGSAAWQAGDYSAAEQAWTRLLAVAPPQGDIAQATMASLAEARARLQGKPALALEGTVDLTPSLKRQLSGRETVFIFARSAEGGGKPLAALRVTAADLPYRFRIDDSHLLDRQQRLDQAGALVVGARLSAAGIVGGDGPRALSAPRGARARGLAGVGGGD